MLPGRCPHCHARVWLKSPGDPIAYHSGPTMTVQTWFAWVDDDDSEHYCWQPRTPVV